MLYRKKNQEQPMRLENMNIVRYRKKESKKMTFFSLALRNKCYFVWFCVQFQQYHVRFAYLSHGRHNKTTQYLPNRAEHNEKPVPADTIDDKHICKYGIERTHVWETTTKKNVEYFFLFLHFIERIEMFASLACRLWSYRCNRDRSEHTNIIQRHET